MLTEEEMSEGVSMDRMIREVEAAKEQQIEKGCGGRCDQPLM